jgi:two-component system, chemotaxis family, chemotaxis protein CheY
MCVHPTADHTTAADERLAVIANPAVASDRPRLSPPTLSTPAAAWLTIRAVADRAINDPVAARDGGRGTRRLMQSYNLTKLSILVLEKHLLIRNLLTEVFREFGVSTVMSTPDTKTAWDMFQQFRLDMILSDWAEGLDGMAFLTRVRQHPDSRDPFVPVIVCTANTEYGHVCFARDTGMTDFLAKPVSARTIYSRICAAIENQRPFIRVSDFFGPDRRRHFDNSFGGLERRRRA